MKMRHFALILFCALISGATAFGVVTFMNQQQAMVEVPVAPTEISIPSKQVSYVGGSPSFNFTEAASVATPAVVHVTTSYTVNNNAQQFYGDDLFEWFFGQQQMPQKKALGSGSGVIVSEDGYIVTNNHVIEDANEIKVVLSNNTEYKAELIGKDKDTDLAVLKIDGMNLPHIEFANSNDVRIGEWVVAVGNPFNLSSTVTAGIVSAKGRSINILENFQGNSNTAIESFIQTDAAVNPGNSGGALVNISGDLIGINTAIATPTGTFAGYSFAVPANLVNKVVADIKEFGAVQRGFMGVNIKNIDEKILSELSLTNKKGVYLQQILENGAADKSGLKAGDIIVSIEGQPINSAPELQEKIAEFRPGDIIQVKYLRDNRTFETDVMLKNKYNNLDIVSNE